MDTELEPGKAVTLPQLANVYDEALDAVQASLCMSAEFLERSRMLKLAAMILVEIHERFGVLSKDQQTVVNQTISRCKDVENVTRTYEGESRVTVTAKNHDGTFIWNYEKESPTLIQLSTEDLIEEESELIRMASTPIP